MHHIPILPLPSNTKIDQLLLTRGHSKFNNFIGRLYCGNDIVHGKRQGCSIQIFDEKLGKIELTNHIHVTSDKFLIS